MTPISGIPDAMTNEEQLSLWVSGQSVHRGNRPNGECCPDFSCCQPALQWPEHIRKRFAQESSRGREIMCMFSLGRSLEYMEARKVHVAGTDVLEKVSSFDDLLRKLDNLKFVCDGPCEGRGFFPCRRNHEKTEYRKLWKAAEAVSQADDLGYHFVTCPVCNGTGKKGKL